ncbi:hypothetical protein F183_A32780 [Bryobacterales bacterium F-183]|nr:hypothetical protein F183_A32780 [Bryobacterales bacterium F-183]
MIETAHLYAPLHAELMQLLRSLTPEDWAKPTVCKGWAVRDIAAHILDTQLRILSMGRDGMLPSAPPDRPLVEFLNKLNADWIDIARTRMSPSVLTSLLAVTGPELANHVESLDPQAPALFGVAWAGEETSANWFDVARNYTEYWHHQQQIRDAVGAEPLTHSRWYMPVLQTFVHAFRTLPVIEGKAVRVAIGNLAWHLQCHNGKWSFTEEACEPDAEFQSTPNAAWRHLTKGCGPEGVQITGDPALAIPMSKVLAVMA